MIGRFIGHAIGGVTTVDGSVTLVADTRAFTLTVGAVAFAVGLADGAVYGIDTTDSGFTGGTYNRNLLRSGLTPGSLAATVPGATTHSLWAITPAGDPGTAGKRTGYTAALNVSSGNANIFGSVQFVRTDSVGSFISQSSVTAEQALTAGTTTFSLAGVDLGTWGATNRLLVVLFMRNSAGTPQSVTIGLGSVASSVSFAGAPYALAGNAAALTPTANAGAGSYALTGIAAASTHTLAAGAGSYTISWQTFSDNETIVANAGSYTFTGNAVYLSYDIDLGGVGSSFSGGTFSRGRWHELKELEAAARLKAELARARIEDAAREAARQRAAEERAATSAARAAEDAANAERAQLQAFADARGAFAGAQRASAQLQGAHALSAAAAQAQLAAEREEEEEAVVHLLLMA